MPHISTAMHRSLRRGVGEIMADSLLGRRDIPGDVSNVKNTFSSWHNCMAQSYCKWPAIIVIVVVSLIVLSVVICIARCACCGYSCCCSCFSFLKCCDCCGDSCAGKKNKPMRHLDGPTPYHGSSQGYQPPEPMTGGGLGARPEAPKFAQFEVGRNGLAVDPKPGLSEDALPPMPSWDTAAKKHVLEEEERDAVELGELDPATGQRMPLMAGAATAASPNPSHDRNASPFGQRPAPGPNPNSYSGVSSNSYAQNQAAFAAPGRAYSPAQDSYRGNGRGYGGPGTPGGQGRGYPQDGNGQGRGYGSPTDPYGAPAPYTDDAGFVVPGYGSPQPDRSYANNGRQFAPQPSREYSNDSLRPLNPGRQYSNTSNPGYPMDNHPPPTNPVSRGPYRDQAQTRMASPPLQNNSGFDFGDDQSQPAYRSRPSPPQQQQQNSYSSANPGRRPSGPQNQAYGGDYYGGGGGSTTPAPTYATRDPQEGDAGQVYSGYGSYGQSNQGMGQGQGQGRGRGGGPGREPPRWDPVQ